MQKQNKSQSVVLSESKEVVQYLKTIEFNSYLINPIRSKNSIVILNYNTLNLFLKEGIDSIVLLVDQKYITLSYDQVNENGVITPFIFDLYYYIIQLRNEIITYNKEQNVKFKIILKCIKSEWQQKYPSNNCHFLHPIKKEIETNKEQFYKEINTQKIKKNNEYFFSSFNLTTSITSFIKAFDLFNYTYFYYRNVEIINDKYFYFKKDIYQFNDSKSKVELKKPEWAERILWVTKDYFRINYVPVGDNRHLRVLEMDCKSNLTDVYGKNFQSYINNYDGFINIPSFFNYKRSVNNLYNRFSPLAIEIKEGEYDIILNFVKHIFGTQIVKYKNKEWSMWELGLDYLQLLLTNPERSLPILCLYSKERNTGKSTFGHLLRILFSENVCSLTSKTISSEFNERYCDKLIGICEEAMLSNRATANYIKAISMEESIEVNGKFKRQYPLRFCCKFVIMSNESDMVFIEQNSERFWVIEVPAPKKDDISLKSKMKLQAPGFLHFLKHRKLATPNVSRMHFDHTMIKTARFFKMVKDNYPTEAAIIHEKISELFIHSKLKKILMPCNDIKNVFFSDRKDINVVIIKKMLENYLNVHKYKNENGKVKQVRSDYPVIMGLNEDGYTSISYENFNGFPYVFYREDFVKDDEIVYVKKRIENNIPVEFTITESSE